MQFDPTHQVTVKEDKDSPSQDFQVCEWDISEPETYLDSFFGELPRVLNVLIDAFADR